MSPIGSPPLLEARGADGPGQPDLSPACRLRGWILVRSTVEGEDLPPHLPLLVSLPRRPSAVQVGP